jgi:hypothetical protein
MQAHGPDGSYAHCVLMQCAQDWQEVEQLVEVARGAAGSFAECTTQLSALGGSAGDAGHGIPPQLRAMELQLAERLHAAHTALRSALSGQMRHCLEQCGWPPPLMPSQSGESAVAACSSSGGSGSSTHACALAPPTELILKVCHRRLSLVM